MDTKYFDKQNIRLKAEDVGEKNLYGLYYDYDSSFEHGFSLLVSLDNLGLEFSGTFFWHSLIFF